MTNQRIIRELGQIPEWKRLQWRARDAKKQALKANQEGRR